MPEYGARYIAPVHLHLFSERSLELILTKAGFEVKAVWCFGQDFLEMLSILHATHYNEIPAPCLGAIPQVQSAIDACELSDTMLVLAQRR